METAKLRSRKADGYLVIRLSGPITMERVERLLESIRRTCARRRATRVLLDVRGMTGSVTLADRYEISVRAVDALAPVVKRAALVAQPGLIHPDKFGVTVATRRGLPSNIFDNVDDAVAWLTAR